MRSMWTEDRDFLERLERRLAPMGGREPAPAPRGDGVEGPEVPRVGLKPAAVLVGLLERPEGLSVLLTLRAAHLLRHAGQVAFPGGRLDPTDVSLEAAALREAEEEVGLDPGRVRVLGRAHGYVTVTGFHVTPVVARVQPPELWRPDPREVADVFETPVSYLMNPAHHETHWREWEGRRRRSYAMPWQGRPIWGATAGMLRALYEDLYGVPEPMPEAISA
jgi:8-oxo-dGTP pyrophosphatase MutT (NUDIX family)